MATQLQLRRGNTAQTAVFTGAIAEVTVDTDQKTLTVHDGVTLGGNYIINKEQFDANVTSINQFAQSAYDTANGANGLAAGAFNLANTSLQNSGNQTLTGNLLINGSINTTEWANSSNAYVSSKLYAGIAPFLSTPLPDLIAQFTGNVASYVQVNAENIDPQGTTDYVATADVGTDTTFYVDFGIQNSQAVDGILAPLDGYLLVQGNTGQIGGNLIVGTLSQTSGQHTKIVSGGLDESNVVIQFNDDLSTLFYGNAIPSVTNTQYLGSSTKRWHSVFVGPGSVDIDNIVLSNNNGQLVITGASDIVIPGSSVPSTSSISNKANNAYDKANAAFDSSNLVNQFAASAYNQANTNATNITALNQFAQSAYDTANSKFNSSGGTISGNVAVFGDLTVTGTTFYANTENLQVKDNIITLNSNVTGAPVLDSGIEINRGTETNTVLKWSESNHAWQFTNDGTNYFRIADTDRVNSVYSLANTNATNISIINGVNETQNTRLNAIETINTDQNTAISIIQGVNLAQNTTITEVNQYAASGYALANTNASNISIINGVDVTQNTRLNSIETINSDQNTAISIIQGVNLGQNTVITEVNQYAASGYAQANTNATDISIIQGVNTTQNTNITAVNNFAASAYNQANTNASNISIINGIDETQNTRLNGIDTSISIIQGVNLGQNTTILEVNQYAQSAYTQANTNAIDISIINGINASQNTRLNGIDTSISIIQGVNLGQNTTITEVNQFAASAYNMANGANGLAQGAYSQANTANSIATGANGLAQGAYNTANTNASNISIINGVDATQNTRLNSIETINADQNTTITQVNQYAASGYAQANTNATNIGIIQGVDATQNTRLNSIETINADQNTAISIIQGVNLGQNTTITEVNQYAASAFNKANTGGTFTGDVTVQQNLTVEKNLVVTGNLIISGNTTSVSANNLVVNDPLIVLANNNTTDVVDIGFIAHYDEISPGENRHTGVIRHAETNEYYIFYNYDKHVHANTGGNNVIDINDSSFLLSNVNANYYKGNLIATTAVIGGTDFANYISVTQGVDNTQNTRLNSIETVNADQNTSITQVNQYAASGYALANTNASNISIINGVDVTQNTRLNAIETINTNQNTSISVIQGVDLTQNTQIQGIQGVDLAQNSAISIIQGVDLTQNTRLDSIETINTNQNTSITQVNQYAASAYAQANTNATNISIINGVDATQNTRLNSIETINSSQNTTITAVNNFAVSAFDRANNSVLKSGDTMTGSLTGVTTLGTTVISLTQTDVTSNTFTTASIAQVSVDAWPVATYRSAKYFVQITSGSSYHIIELNLVHNGTTVFLAQYGEVLTGSSLGTFDADISGGTVRLLFTGTNAVSTVKVLRTVMDV